ncbi:MAG: Rid family hydrolase [Chitinivibrionales bacterium]|nr:Rid family hydrolase [Chitinivibrionales bacterium]
MSNLTIKRLSESIRYSHFATDAGCEEFFITVRTRPGIDPARGLQALADDYGSALTEAGLSDTTVVFSRLYVSDFVNQKEKIDSCVLRNRLRQGALSIIEQKPVDGGPFSLFSWHIRNPKHPAAVCQTLNAPENYSTVNRYTGKNYSLLFTANFTNNALFDAAAQTTQIFKDLGITLADNSMRMLDNTIRTWIYVRDVDNHYKNMVRSRREFFTEQGLTASTRYLASTGIEGGNCTPDRIVSVDSLSIGGLQSGQIVRMEAPEHLSPTIVYGVTFERGLRVKFGDRSHLYVSGTASINKKGEVLHLGDVAAQTRRTLENLRALLGAHNTTLKDLAFAFVYVRNFHEWPRVEAVLREEISAETPLIALEAKVCRPQWLMEIEAMAIIPDKNDFSPFL